MSHNFEAFKRLLAIYPRYISIDEREYAIINKRVLAPTASGLLRDAALQTRDLGGDRDKIKKHRNAQEILIDYIAARAYMFIRSRQYPGYEDYEDDVVSKVCTETLNYIRNHNGFMGHRLRAHICTLTHARCIDMHRKMIHPEPHIEIGNIDIAITNGLRDIANLNKFLSDAVTTLLCENRLSQLQADIICHRYGLGDYEHIKQLNKIAAKIGIPPNQFYRLNQEGMTIFSEYCYDNYRDELLDYLGALNPKTVVQFLNQNENE